MKSVSVCLAALFILLCVALGSSTKLALPHPLGPCEGIDNCLWDYVTINAKVFKLVTISVDVSVSTVNQPLLDAIIKAKLAGVLVFAKIKTGFGNRSLVDVKVEIDLCVNLYKVDGIVFDEVPKVCSCKAYYSDLYAYVKLNIAGLVVLNVGVHVPECFGLFADILVVFDSSYDDYLKFVPLPWYSKPGCTFWHNVHSCPKLFHRAALSLAIKLNAGFCYVTDKPQGVPPTHLLDLELLVRLLGLLSINLDLNLL